MRVLITGGAGFIGSNLARHMTSEGHEVRIIDDLSTGSTSNLSGLDVDFHKDTILNEQSLVGIMRGVDSVVHLGAIPSVPRSINDPRASHDANITGTLCVLEAARATHTQHIIVASSSSIYGANTALPKRELDWLRPMSPYAVSKLATEAYALAYRYSYGMKTLAFRFFNVYGPCQAADHAYAAVIPKFLAAALAGRPLPVHGDGSQSRDFTYIDTVCQVISDAAVRRVSDSQPVNLAYGTSTTLNELIERLEVAIGRSLDISYLEPRIGDVRASQADNVRVKKLFPTIAPLSLDQGLAQTLAWFQRQPTSVTV